MTKQKELTRIYEALRPYVMEVGQSKMANPDFYQISLKAALVKNFDFNFYVSQMESDSHSFYLTATLRGMCEDIIVLKSLMGISQQDRSKLVSHIQMLSVYESMKSQKEFFEQNRPAQPVLCFKDIDTKIQEEEAEMLQLYNKYNLLSHKGRKPTVKQLARNSGLLSIYEFFYSATSKWVHFNPHILFRMGWSNDPNPLLGNYTFSTEHFSGYYESFNRIYGAYLLAIFHDTFANQLNMDTKAEMHITELRTLMDEIWRWAEVITFEEMNIKPPSEILYAAMRVIKEREAEN